MIRTSLPTQLRNIAPRLRRETSAIAMVEFALILPLFAMVTVAALEISNYIVTKMRVSQAALHLADHIARIGSGDPMAAKQITETQINDVLIGTGMQTGALDLYNRGRVVVSSIEEDTVNVGKYKIAWQRCQGVKNYTPLYGSVTNASPSDDTNLTGVGPTGRQVTAPPSGQTIFVEVYYEYQPIINTRYLSAPRMFTEIASMPVRDRREAGTIHNAESAPQHLCTQFTAT